MLGWLKGLSSLKKMVVALVSVTTIGVASAAVVPPSTNPPTKAGDNVQVKGASIQTKMVSETKSIPFQSTTQNDSSLASGTTKVVTQGVNGIETINYEVTYTNGVETSRQKTSDQITTQPINQVTAIGTYVAPTCPNGTYVNSAGNTVCSPYEAPGPPAGATAQCGDGTYSFSQSRSGTCSHHGGVALWL